MNDKQEHKDVEWIYRSERYYICPKCGKRYDLWNDQCIREANFCPNCGSYNKIRKMGRWIERKNVACPPGKLDDYNLSWRYECSECGCEHQHKIDYCRKCCAKMDNADKENKE